MPELTPQMNRATKLRSVATQSSFWLFCVDLYLILAAASIPWSTSAVSIFMALWFVALIPTIKPGPFLQSLKRPASLLPIGFMALAMVGTLWADGPWSVRLGGINPVVKLLAIPFLLYHFERSGRGVWVFIAFLISCTLLMGLSFAVLFEPGWKISATEPAGVPVKNYIDQSQEFALCIFALASLVAASYARQHWRLAALSAVLLLGFFVNMMFVASARTALVYMPVLLLVFAIRHLSRRATALLFGLTTASVVLVWSASPYLRQRVEHIAVEYQLYRERFEPTSTGLRIEYWRTSIDSIIEAPLFGHGTGSTKQVFERFAAGKHGAWADSIRNPHNQTLSVAIQWGALGCVVLYAMWRFHLLLFRDKSFAAWVGLVVVVQNIISSLFNSHLFDFHEGWMYVLGVGVAGGMVTRAKNVIEAHPRAQKEPAGASREL